jgi:5'-phosphate synthase pdxT subunit
MTGRTVVVGVLALQGAFSEHINVLKIMESTVEAIEIRTEQELNRCDALILPGGESTAIILSAERNGMVEPLVQFIKSGKPVWV